MLQEIQEGKALWSLSEAIAKKRFDKKVLIKPFFNYTIYIYFIRPALIPE
jgi:hypothetical protein